MRPLLSKANPQFSHPINIFETTGRKVCKNKHAFQCVCSHSLCGLEAEERIEAFRVIYARALNNLYFGKISYFRNLA